MFLLDVNVLVALGWNTHPHYQRAHASFSANRDQGWATSPTTQCGFIRISCNPKAVTGVVVPSVAISVLRKIVAEPGHVFLAESLVATDVRDIGLRGYKQITDAYLISVARHHGAKLATFDAAMATLPAGLGSAVEVIR